MIKKYDVTLSPRFPASASQPMTIMIAAPNKAEAIREARRQNRIECWYDRFNGKVTYTAKEVDG